MRVLPECLAKFCVFRSSMLMNVAAAIRVSIDRIPSVFGGSSGIGDVCSRTLRGQAGVSVSRFASALTRM